MNCEYNRLTRQPDEPGGCFMALSYYAAKAKSILTGATKIEAGKKHWMVHKGQHVSVRRFV
jgi:hypothetical protein